MAHSSKKLINHLQNFTTSIKITNISISKRNECETCAFIKNQQIISRFDHKFDDRFDFLSNLC